ncbi:MAG: SMC-Scp complex subunit ScpB [Candidatus Lambdaproteobacteria bacterium]|nr:SMC-Scp complex subunit ScpB [Candidatus Lambdaproteobacteria bacterium]
MIDSDARRVLEAVLFSSPEVLGARQLAQVLGSAEPDQVHRWIDELNAEYESGNRSFRIERAGDGYQMRTLPLYKTWVQKAEPLKPVRLGQPTLETLAIVAYRQPVTRAEIEHLRGVDSSSGLRNLLEKKLIRILGKDQAPGRPILYGTTRNFLSLFSLADLKDLPTLEEFDLSPAATATVVAFPDPQQAGRAG